MKHNKKVKVHKMYCKDGSVHNVDTLKKHKALLKKGCGHSPLKFKKSKPSKKAKEALAKGADTYDTRRYMGHKSKKEK
jgi:hypothetical protein